jgi:hypothetical protein
LQSLLLDLGQDTQRLSVSLEATVLLHTVIKRALAVVPERRMPEVVSKTSELDQVKVDGVFLELGRSRVQHQRYALRNLRYFQGVRQAIAEEIRFMPWEELGLPLEPTKRG